MWVGAFALVVLYTLVAHNYKQHMFVYNSVNNESDVT